MQARKKRHPLAFDSARRRLLESRSQGCTSSRETSTPHAAIAKRLQPCRAAWRSMRPVQRGRSWLRSLHVLARRVESGCRVSGESMSVRLRVSAQLDAILVGLLEVLITRVRAWPSYCASRTPTLHQRASRSNPQWAASSQCTSTYGKGEHPSMLTYAMAHFRVAAAARGRLLGPRREIGRR